MANNGFKDAIGPVVPVAVKAELMQRMVIQEVGDLGDLDKGDRIAAIYTLTTPERAAIQATWETLNERENQKAGKKKIDKINRKSVLM